MNTLNALVIACTAVAMLAVGTARAAPDPMQVSQYGTFAPGFVVNAEVRFDPFVQRLMAERSLKALPLKDGQLFYIVPVNVDPHIEQTQIRYLEWLLDKQNLEPSAARP
jgi:hypothetical protein